MAAASEIGDDALRPFAFIGLDIETVQSTLGREGNGQGRNAVEDKDPFRGQFHRRSFGQGRAGEAVIEGRVGSKGAAPEPWPKGLDGGDKIKTAQHAGPTRVRCAQPPIERQGLNRKATGAKLMCQNARQGGLARSRKTTDQNKCARSDGAGERC